MWFSLWELFIRLILLYFVARLIDGMMSWHHWQNPYLWLTLAGLQMACIQSFCYHLASIEVVETQSYPIDLREEKVCHSSPSKIFNHHGLDEGTDPFPSQSLGHCQYGADLAKQLTDLLQNVLWSCGSVRISFSRRTPRKVSDFLVREFGSNPKVYIWNGEDPNPHMGHLAWADAFVITADSVSMLSEACSTGKPVYVIGADRCTWKFADFQNSLGKRGVVRPFTGKENMDESWSYPPLNDTAEAAGRVVEALAERGWRLQPS